MEFWERLLLRGEQRANMIERYLIPKLKEDIERRTKEVKEDIERRTKEMEEIREAVKQFRETGDEDAFVRLTALAFPLKGKD